MVFELSKCVPKINKIIGDKLELLNQKIKYDFSEIFLCFIISKEIFKIFKIREMNLLSGTDKSKPLTIGNLASQDVQRIPSRKYCST